MTDMSFNLLLLLLLYFRFTTSTMPSSNSRPTSPTSTSRSAETYYPSSETHIYDGKTSLNVFSELSILFDDCVWSIAYPFEIFVFILKGLSLNIHHAPCVELMIYMVLNISSLLLLLTLLQSFMNLIVDFPNVINEPEWFSMNRNSLIVVASTIRRKLANGS
jgi:hypothetical protein